MFAKTLKLLTATALAAGLTPAHAITDGSLDGNGHPFVGLMVAKAADGKALWRCSGTLLSPTVFLTAGHCTEEPAASAEVFFEADVQHNVPRCLDFPAADPCYPLKGDASGAIYTHPDFYSAPFFVHDAGVVVLDSPVEMDAYGVLPTQDVLDNLKTQRGLKNQTVTAVGYGLQLINPVFVEQLKIRMYATPHLIQINVPGFTGDFSLLLSNNHSTGGTCFGDSGGPNFIGNSNVIGGVTSFGINGNCAGTGGVFRMDRASALDWVKSFLE